MRSCVEVTPHMIKCLMNGLREDGVDFVVAPYEADPQMAYMVNNGFADFAITEDSDLLVYNCRLCLFKLDSNGSGRLMDASLITGCLGSGFDFSKFRHMSILSGCDYLPNLPGIGLQRAKKFFKMTANTDLRTVLYKIPSYLKMNGKVKITKDYVNDFIKADNTFKYQLVFCPKSRKLVPLTPYEKDVTPQELTFAGTHFPSQLGEDFAFQYAIGNVDTKSLEIIDDYSFEPKEDSIWSKDWFNYKKMLTTNELILQKCNPSKTMATNDSKQTPVLQTRSPNKKTNELQESVTSRKRLKVNESQFINCRQLMTEYSSEVKADKSPPKPISTQSNYTLNKIPNNCILMKAAIPFAVSSSLETHEVKGRKVRGRAYGWGIVETENPEHSDFVMLRSMLVTHMQDLREVTQDVHYENYRSQRLVARNISNSDLRDNISISSDDTSKDRILQEKEAELKRMQGMIERMQREMMAQQQQAGWVVDGNHQQNNGVNNSVNNQ
ncbi:unnamed protein product [Medioppia subpectinata]|uniref:Exonuclease 1 n=1 Tax=Medioppia subpectinata TaxID=1979941 RepID=A0A7R9KTA9_9ACAR|nr:unnamed protein product [Medioppia subpectinata]CAG2109433.1 unnamed protein product [Medioppia subpectinata]